MQSKGCSDPCYVLSSLCHPILSEAHSLKDRLLKVDTMDVYGTRSNALTLTANDTRSDSDYQCTSTRASGSLFYHICTRLWAASTITTSHFRLERVLQRQRMDGQTWMVVQESERMFHDGEADDDANARSKHMYTCISQSHHSFAMLDVRRSVQICVHFRFSNVTHLRDSKTVLRELNTVLLKIGK